VRSDLCEQLDNLVCVLYEEGASREEIMAEVYAAMDYVDQVREGLEAAEGGA
jgi:hypothetical protein